MAFDNAYHLSIIVSGVAGVFILYLFLLEAFGLATALAGFVFLALLPRYFGDLHNNMKDVPQTAAFALAIYMFWRLAKYKRIKDVVFATLAFAVAFNTKVNTLLVPIIAGMWWSTTALFSQASSHLNHEVRSMKYDKKAKIFLSIIHNSRFIISTFNRSAALSPLAAVWKHPIDRLSICSGSF